MGWINSAPPVLAAIVGLVILAGCASRNEPASAPTAIVTVPIALPTPPSVAASNPPAEASGSVFPRHEAMKTYIDAVKRKVRTHMKFKTQAPQLETLFQIALAPDMRILGAKVVRSSGNRTFDQAARAAVLKAGSYPPLPDGIDFAPFASHKILYKLHDTP